MKHLRWAVPVLAVSALLIFPSCGGNNAPPFNQTPSLTLIVPSNITAGSQDFTLFISGTGFIADQKGVTFAYWNGSPRSTNLNVNTGQLEVSISAADVANPGVVNVSVTTPGPGGGPSQNSLPFQIVQVQPGAPVITSLSPSSVDVNATPPKVAITGSNFAAGDVVTWNGGDRASTSTFLDQNDMTVQATAADVSAAGTASISVSTPGLIIASPSVNLTITASGTSTPSVRSLSPSSAAAGSADLEVTVSGSGFVSSSTLLWNSNPVATAFLDSSHLVALIPASLLTTAGTANVSVVGGTGTGVSFTIGS